MAKGKTLLAMLAGAALAGGYLYAKKLNEENAAAPETAGDGFAPEDEAEKTAADYGWKATYTDPEGNEVNAEEATAEFKEEAVKALNEFKESAKVVGGEILVGLKKAYEDMKVAVADAQQAAAELRAQKEAEVEAAEAADPVEAGEKVEEAADEVADAVAEKVEKAEECCCGKAEEVKEAVEEKVEEVTESVADAFEDIK